ncbi:uncharacterized protein LOC135195976 [Macrobrachium nipponense]|uniref:uncharacterized protein LOC135195976 n=1 Tax=Macrobrachium nipponense TaxID=159736 RepID=UPI0030C7B681
MLNGDKQRTGGSRNLLCSPLSRIPVPSRIPAPISPGVGAFGRLPLPVASRPLRPLRTHSSVSNSPRDLEMEQSSTPTATKPMGPPRTSMSRGSVRSGSRGVSRVSANSRMTSGRGSAASSKKDSDQEDS